MSFLLGHALAFYINVLWTRLVLQFLVTVVSEETQAENNWSQGLKTAASISKDHSHSKGYQYWWNKNTWWHWKTVADCSLIRDKTGEAKFDLWQKHVGTLTVGKTYIISNAIVKIYNEQHTPKDGSLKVEEPTDILPVKTKRSLCSAQVICVRTLKAEILCVACRNGEIILSETHLLAPALNVQSQYCAKETSADLVIKSQTFRHWLSKVSSWLL